MRLFFALPLILVTLLSYSQNINIKLFSEEKISAFKFIVENGKYEIVGKNKVVRVLGEGEGVRVKARKRKMKLRSLHGKSLGKYDFLHIRGVADTNNFKISSVVPKLKERKYSDDINVTFNNRILDVINDVDFERYIAGVVESEGGAWSHIEYYKSQAILCRTYAIKNYTRHLNEGFNLCDGVHCQAYKNRCLYNQEIVVACDLTHGVVVVDKNKNLISATFYSNSGGQTANSEDVWKFAFPYLRSIDDPYSLGQRNTNWERKILKKNWIAYLQNNGATIDFSNVNFTFNQRKRKINYDLEGFLLPLKKIRSDWKLKSTFFSIYEEGEYLVLKGKGYGHGVGLAQEGAMKMAKMGLGYEKIIKFYYKGVSLSNINNLGFFKVE